MRRHALDLLFYHLSTDSHSYRTTGITSVVIRLLFLLLINNLVMYLVLGSYAYYTHG